MTPTEKIEEAHGLWELQVARVAAMVEILFDDTTVILTALQAESLRDASDKERVAFEHWQNVSGTEINSLLLNDPTHPKTAIPKAQFIEREES